jgi:Fur family ferric uptake transcriptional regulator
VKTREQLLLELREQGFRLTPQREKIIDIFFHLPEGEHLSAEELHTMLRQESSDISLATSYRTLKLLASVGVLRELDFAEDHKHYELARNPESPHHHIICVECRTTEEFDSPEAFHLVAAMAEQKQFHVVDVQLKVFGFCSHCRAEKNAKLVSRST